MNEHSSPTIRISEKLFRALSLKAISQGLSVDEWVEEALRAALQDDGPSDSGSAREAGADDSQSPLWRGRELRRSGHSLNAIGKALGMPYAWVQAELSGVPVDSRATIARLWSEGLEANQITDALKALRIGFDPADIDLQTERNPHHSPGMDVYRP